MTCSLGSRLGLYRKSKASIAWFTTSARNLPARSNGNDLDSFLRRHTPELAKKIPWVPPCTPGINAGGPNPITAFWAFIHVGCAQSHRVSNVGRTNNWPGEI